jgi:UDP-N-acetylmuramoylalanine--D-glutamate ligase
VLDLKDIHLVGRHNRENIAAASLAALCMGANMEAVQGAVNDFKGLAHRMTYVASVSDVAYYNDSKATNVDAVKRAMETFSSPLILIMGGRDKGGMFHLIKDAMTRVKELIVMGEAGEFLAGMFKDCVPITRATDMEDAVAKAHGRAVAGDVVLLSPGCASFDMYESYVHRGKTFEAAVLRLKEKTRGKIN